jgi:hypothetical protein
MGRECSMHLRDKDFIHILAKKNMKGRDYMGDRDVGYY